MDPQDSGGLFQRLHRRLNSKYLSGVNSNIHSSNNNNAEIGPRSTWENYSEYTRSSATSGEPHSSRDNSMAWKELAPPSQDDYDGMGMELDDDEEEDPELVRKKQELRIIEERIMHKKASIAIKTVERLTDATWSADSQEHPTAGRSSTLRDRVMRLLHHRHQPSFFSKFQSPRDRPTPSTVSNEHHPLKLRVKAALSRRSRNDPRCLPRSSLEVPHVSLAPPHLKVPSPVNEKNNVDRGFERFLDVLNKGVDINLLSRIVNDDTEDLPAGDEPQHIHCPNTEDKLNLPVRNERQQSVSEGSLSGHSWIDSMKAESQRREQSPTHSPPQPEQKKDHRGDRSLGSSSHSKSPVAVKNIEEREAPKANHQHLQLQDILKTLGLNLDVEDLSKVSDRTQERLYGKKSEDPQNTVSQGEPESRKRSFPTEYSRSSSSSSCSRSVSRVRSPSPLHDWPSHSREQSCSGDTDRDQQRHQDHPQDHEDGSDYQQMFDYEDPYSENPSYRQHHSALQASPGYSQSVHYDSSSSSQAAYPYQTHPEKAHIPSVLHGTHPSNQQQQFLSHVVASNNAFRPPLLFQDLNLILNPDLAESEGQTGAAQAPRCLKVVTPQQLCLMGFTKNFSRSSRKRGKKKKQEKRRHVVQLANQGQNRPQSTMGDTNKQKQSQASAQMDVMSQDVGQSHTSEHTGEPSQERQPQTEEEIKANLRKKLQAFNQKMKKSSQVLSSTAHSRQTPSPLGD